jgi:formylglycine-generating enzyme required for sulfatase activity
MKHLLAMFLFPLALSGSAFSAQAADKTFTNGIGMEFMPIPAGEFWMGCYERKHRFWKSKGEHVCLNDEEPRHRVVITRPFFLGKYEVTQREWERVMGKGNNPSEFKGDERPVDNVSWNDVQEFIRKLNANEGGRIEYRLPTEAEWEYAARAGTETRYSFGDGAGKLGDYAWFEENSDGQTHPVGQKQPNPWGLYDMHGNVAEWVQDRHGHDYYQGSALQDPRGPSSGSSFRVVRGGSRFDGTWYLWSSRRRGCLPEGSFHTSGFRLAFSPAHP